jgi:hypothetical protein
MIFRFTTFAGLAFVWEQSTPAYYIPFPDSKIEGIVEVNDDPYHSTIFEVIHQKTGIAKERVFEIGRMLSIAKRYVLTDDGYISTEGD